MDTLDLVKIVAFFREALMSRNLNLSEIEERRTLSESSKYPDHVNRHIRSMNETSCLYESKIFKDPDYIYNIVKTQGEQIGNNFLYCLETLEKSTKAEGERTKICEMLMKAEVGRAKIEASQKRIESYLIPSPHIRNPEIERLERQISGPLEIIENEVVKMQVISFSRDSDESVSEDDDDELGVSSKMERDYGEMSISLNDSQVQPPITIKKVGGNLEEEVEGEEIDQKEHVDDTEKVDLAEDEERVIKKEIFEKVDLAEDEEKVIKKKEIIEKVDLVEDEEIIEKVDFVEDEEKIEKVDLVEDEEIIEKVDLVEDTEKVDLVEDEEKVIKKEIIEKEEEIIEKEEVVAYEEEKEKKEKLKSSLTLLSPSKLENQQQTNTKKQQQVRKKRRRRRRKKKKKKKKKKLEEKEEDEDEDMKFLNENPGPTKEEIAEYKEKEQKKKEEKERTKKNQKLMKCRKEHFHKIEEFLLNKRNYDDDLRSVYSNLKKLGHYFPEKDRLQFESVERIFAREKLLGKKK